ncbi:MAG: L-sorbosone dehydrogenase [Cyclobacteriaceae bacterium]|nr:MAG: L-sorbosone dehydrogenase [Cyclobacteriaceae bacterium]
MIISCKTPDKQEFDISNIAANEEVANYMRSFKGRGDLADTTAPTNAQEAVAGFVLPKDLNIELVLSEPQIHQPLEITFDHRGRLWVVQYNQYPYPEGLKLTGIDNHLRAQFDKVPKPPPAGAIGADKITFFEDTNGDGKFDKSTDAITGLNITTGVEFGRGRIWVLNPPYLLAYADSEGDGLPDGPPEVHLTGFGLEDTHAVANSLRWGPDGWLYGATGSTVTSDISSEVTKNVRFQGQGIWRYHPENKLFEVFAEGGGNTFHVEMDAKGRIYSGDNGATRGQYYKQGAYYTKNWGKHGPLTNPHAFGYLKNMELEGEPLRFTHAWIRYEGGALPAIYDNKMVAINPLLNYLQLCDMVQEGSTFKTVDLERLVETEDHWFRPVDIKVGPDGAVYLADWYDSRLSHVDPKDNWHKSSGRIYRITAKNQEALPSFDLSKYSSEQLVQVLSHRNKWFRQQAIRQFGDRKDADIVDQLADLLNSGSPQEALEALWAINISGYFDDKVAKTALSHGDPYVRLWAVRLLGDSGSIPKGVYQHFLQMVIKEQHPEVQSQIACTAKRIPANQAIPLIQRLIQHPELASDPDNSLLTWWAIEAKTQAAPEQVIEMFRSADIWKFPLVQQTILPKLSQKLVMVGSDKSLEHCTTLLSLAPDSKSANSIIEGIQEGLMGKDLGVLPENLIAGIGGYQKESGQAPLAFNIQQKDQQAILSAVSIIKDAEAPINDKMVYIKLMGALQITEAVEVLVELVESADERTSLRKAAIEALGHFSINEIGEKIAAAYPDKLRADPVLRVTSLDVLSSREDWAMDFLNLIEITRQVKPEDVPVQIIHQFQLLGNNKVTKLVDDIWPNIKAAQIDKQRITQRIVQATKSGNADFMAGRMLYLKNCGSCHKLFKEGGDLGPDLTGYERSNLNYLITNIVDPDLDIREGFVNYKLVTEDNRTLVGILVNRTSEVLELKTFSGAEYTIPVNQVKVMEAQATSIMPERLVDNLSDNQLRDLFGYIMQNEFHTAN